MAFVYTYEYIEFIFEPRANTTATNKNDNPYNLTIAHV